jgi:hypothetical protein
MRVLLYIENLLRRLFQAMPIDQLVFFDCGTLGEAPMVKIFNYKGSTRFMVLQDVTPNIGTQPKIEGGRGGGGEIKIKRTLKEGQIQMRLAST